MAKLEVHAGNFLTGRSSVSFGSFSLRTKEKPILGETIPFKQLVEVGTASEESVKRFGGTIGWGAAGAVVLSPVGLLAGLLIGGRGKDVTLSQSSRMGGSYLPRQIPKPSPN